MEYEREKMGRILFFVLIGVAIWLIWRGSVRITSRKETPGAPPAVNPAGEDMVQCMRCGVNLPRSEARLENGQLVCHNNPHCLPSK